MSTDSTKKLQDDLRDSAHKIWLAGLGALSAAEEGGEKLFKSLVEKGEKLEAQGKEKVEEAQEKLGDTWKDLEARLDDRITSVLHRVGVPSRDEIQLLTKRVEELNKKVEELTSHRLAKTA